MQLKQALLDAAALGVDRLDAQVLLLHALGRPAGDRAWLVAHDTDALPPDAAASFVAACGRRAAGEPAAYITGRKDFFGLELAVDARVLVPRPETETLVEWALDLPDVATVVDLGTGSGAIAIALKHTRPQLDVTMVDVSADALAVARANAVRHGLTIAARQASWLDGANRRFDLVVSNPPYIVEGDGHLPALSHEPRAALTSGPDGLDAIRTIVGQAADGLSPGGWLLLEHGHDQAGRVRALLDAAGFVHVSTRADLAGIPRCTGGKRPSLG